MAFFSRFLVALFVFSGPPTLKTLRRVLSAVVLLKSSTLLGLLARNSLLTVGQQMLDMNIRMFITNWKWFAYTQLHTHIAVTPYRVGMYVFVIPFVYGYPLG